MNELDVPPNIIGSADVIVHYMIVKECQIDNSDDLKFSQRNSWGSQQAIFFFQERQFV